MSITQAIALNEDGYSLEAKFQKWYEASIDRKKTIFDALDQFAGPGEHFDFPVGFDFIYQLNDSFHFVPSVEDLYWMELEVLDRDAQTPLSSLLAPTTIACADIFLDPQAPSRYISA